jgi:hypothetical protein
MRKASPLVHVPGLSKTAIAAAEDLPTDAATDFVDIETSAIDTRGGLVAPAAITDAVMPNWQHYDTGRIVFGALTITGVLEDLTVELWAIDAQGIPFQLGRSTVSPTNTLAPISFPIAGRVKYALQVSGVTYTDTGTVAFPVFVQGYYRDADDA